MVRKERDSLGEVEIPDGRLYGPETVRALSNFPYYRPMDRRIIDTLIVIKRSYVRAFTSKGKISKDIGDIITKAADELVKNKNEQDFPLKYIQAGAGTSTNMNVNEVIANKALEMLGKPLGSHDLISPHNQVNIGQSTNDTIPAAIRITTYFALKSLSKGIEKTVERLDTLATEYANKIKTGRTHIQDASAVTFGGEFKAYSDQLRSFLEEKDYILSRLKRLNLGGTAVGTGANLPKDVRDLVYRNINEYYGESFVPAENLMMVMQFASDFNLLASWFSNLSATLIKMSRDLRMMNSGPVAGFNEIILPAVQPGSSIMPGKVNPSILEAVTMSALFTRGLAQTVNDAASQGEMEINVFTPVIYTVLMEAFDILTVTFAILEEKTLKGIKINSDYAYQMLVNSPGTALLLNPVLGYEKTAEIVKEAKEKNVPFLKLLRERKILSEEEIDKIFSPENMLNK